LTNSSNTPLTALQRPYFPIQPPHQLGDGRKKRTGTKQPRIEHAFLSFVKESIEKPRLHSKSE
ncbi:MAG: hypothetical protein RR320_05925, partial [Oscillospiraceae bacterium]